MSATNLRELARRRYDGIEVTLLWDAGSNQVSLQVLDEREGRSRSIPLPPTSALDAFYHPYAYVAV